MTATTPMFPKGSFDFAFPSAFNLAEAGATVEDKRIGKIRNKPGPLGDTYLLGYLFCAEMIPLNHEMWLMLVNTLRKVSFLTRLSPSYL